MKAMLLGISVSLFGVAVAIGANGIVGIIVSAFGLAFSIAGDRDDNN